jgi:hypothetical protein
MKKLDIAWYEITQSRYSDLELNQKRSLLYYSSTIGRNEFSNMFRDLIEISSNEVDGGNRKARVCNRYKNSNDATR